MTKRTFIKILTVMMANPVISRLYAWAAPEKLKNWAGNLEYGTERLFSASSPEQVRDYVRKEDKLKVLGTRHCFNNVADSLQGTL